MILPPSIRTGSHPYRYISDDLGLPYDLVVNYASFLKAHTTLPAQKIKEAYSRQNGLQEVFGYWPSQAAAQLADPRTCSADVMVECIKRVSAVVHGFDR